MFTKSLDSKWFEFLRQNISVISKDWSLLLLLLFHAFASSFIHCFVYLTCFCLFIFLVLLYFFFHINFFFKKSEKSEKYKNSVFVYFGTCVPWMAIEINFSKLCIFCSLDEHLYAQRSKWALWLMFVMSKVKWSLVLKTRITLFDVKD